MNSYPYYYNNTGGAGTAPVKPKKKSNFSTVLLVLTLIAGLGLLLYPSVSNFVNSRNSSVAVEQYIEDVAAVNQDKYESVMRMAEEYNKSVAGRGGTFNLSDTELDEYQKALDVSGNGVMGYIEIPAIDVSLPIYHGTSEKILQNAAGHLEWTSLPIGGEDTHCVISGHRGLPGAKLFTNLDELVNGDKFMLNVLGKTCVYEVDEIKVVEPQQTDDLQIEKGKDYCTLVTCTPYGINTHRLLIRGHRIEMTQEEIIEYAAATTPRTDTRDTVLIIIVLVAILVAVMFCLPKKKRNKW